jgi:hypothetical protein
MAVFAAMDKISGVLQGALGGVQSSLKALDAAAQKIATAPVRRDESAGLADPLVDALVAQRSLEASAALIERADDMFGALLDELADDPKLAHRCRAIESRPYNRPSLQR